MGCVQPKPFDTSGSYMSPDSAVTSGSVPPRPVKRMSAPIPPAVSDVDEVARRP